MIQQDTRYQPNQFDDIFTPPKATRQIIPFLRPEWRILEPCWGRGDMAEVLKEAGLCVLGSAQTDFFDSLKQLDWDCLVTNPPYSNHRDFVEAALDCGRPFAFLLRLAHLGGVRSHRMYADSGVQIIIPEKRIQFITPKKTGTNTFHNVWVTRGLELESDLVWLPD